MLKIKFEEAVQSIVNQDGRFRREGYFFLREGLDHTIRNLEKPIEGPGRHVSGAELLAGLRHYALEEFGPMASTVLESWGIHSTDDLGVMVFHLVEEGVLGKTDQDSPADFAGGFDFDEAFRRPFLPERDREKQRQEQHGS